MKNKLTQITFILIFFFTIPLAAQEVDIVPFLKKIEQGKIEEVKSVLPDLKKEYPKSSNVLFLEGVLTENAQDAVVIYQDLVNSYPKSAFADASLYRIYSYYFALGLYNTADKFLTRLKNDYPESPYIKMASLNKSNDEGEQKLPVKSSDDDILGQNYKFTVQAGAFTNSINASKLNDEFKNAGMKSFIKEKNVGGTVFHVVYVGQFVSKDKAEDFLHLVNSQFNISGRVVEIEK